MNLEFVRSCLIKEQSCKEQLNQLHTFAMGWAQSQNLHLFVATGGIEGLYNAYKYHIRLVGL